MSRRERRQNKRESQKKIPPKSPPEIVSKGERIFAIAVSLTIVFFFLYLAHRDNSLPEDELSSIYVTLKDTPKYDEYQIKSTTYRDIILTTKEYQREFKITAMTYNATNHDAFKTNVFAGDKVELKVKKSDLEDLNDNTYWNNYNDVYGLSKDGINYIDIKLRTRLIDIDSKYAYFMVVFGLVILPYGFIKRKPYIDFDTAIAATAIIGLIVLFIAHKLK